MNRKPYLDWAKQGNPSPRNFNSSFKSVMSSTSPNPADEEKIRLLHRSQADLGNPAPTSEETMKMKTGLKRGLYPKVPEMEKKITKTITELESELAKTRQKLREQKVFKETVQQPKKTPVMEVFGNLQQKERSRPERGRSAEPQRDLQAIVAPKREPDSSNLKELPLSFTFAVHRSEENVITLMRKNGLIVTPKLREEISRVFVSLEEGLKNINIINRTPPREDKGKLSEVSRYAGASESLVDDYRKISRQLQEEFDKIQQASSINGRLISIMLEKIEIDIDHTKSDIRLHARYDNTREPESVNSSGKKTRSNSQAPKSKPTNELEQRIIDLQGEFNKLALEFKKKDQNSKELEQLFKKKDKSTLQLLEDSSSRMTRRSDIEASIGRQRSPTEDSTRKEELIKKLQVELDTAEYLLKRKKEEEAKQGEKGKKAETLLSGLCSYVDRFLSAMQKLQRGVAKQDSGAIPRLKEEFETSKKELQELTVSSKQYCSLASQAKTAGRIVNLNIATKPKIGGQTDVFSSTAPNFNPSESQDDALNSSITKYKVKPVASSELEKKVRDLEKERVKKEDEIRQYLEIIEQQKKELAAVAQIQYELEEANKRIREQILSLDDLKRSNNKMGDDNVRVMEENKRLAKESEKIQENFRVLIENNNHINDENKKLIEDYEKLSEEFKKIEEDNRHKEVSLYQKEREIQSLNEIYEKITEESSSKDYKLAESEALINQLRARLDMKDSDRGESAPAIDYERIQNAVNNAVLGNQETINGLMDNIAKDEERLLNLGNSVQALKELVEYLKAGKDALEKQSVEYNGIITKLREGFNKAQNEKNTLTKKINNNEENYKVKLEEKDKVIENLQQKLAVKATPTKEAKVEKVDPKMIKKVSELEQTLNQKNEEITVTMQNMMKLQNELEGLKGFLIERDAEYTQQKSIIESLMNAEGAGMVAERAGRAKINENEDEVGELQKKAEDLNSENEILKEDIKKLAEINAELTKQNEDLAELNGNNEVKLKAKEDEVEKMKEDIKKATKNQDETANYAALSQAMIEEQRMVYERLEAIKTNMDIVEEAQSKMKIMSERIQVINQEFAKLAAKYRELSNTNKELSDENARLAEKCEKAEEIPALIEENNKVKSEYKSLKQEYDKLKEEDETNKINYKQFAESNDQLENDYANLESQHEILKNRCEAMTKDAENMKAQVEAINQEKGDLMNAVSMHKAKNLSIVKKLKEIVQLQPIKALILGTGKYTLEAIAKSKENAKLSLTHLIEAIRAKTGKFETQIKELKQSITESGSPKDKVMSEKMAIEKRYKDLFVQYTSLEEDNKELEEQLKSKTDTLKEQHKREIEIEAKLKEKEAECKNLEQSKNEETKKLAKYLMDSKLNLQRICDSFSQSMENIRNSILEQAMKCQASSQRIEEIAGKAETISEKIKKEREEQTDAYSSKIEEYKKTIEQASSILLNALGVEQQEEAENIIAVANAVKVRIAELANNGQSEDNLRKLMQENTKNFNAQFKYLNAFTIKQVAIVMIKINTLSGMIDNIWNKLVASRKIIGETKDKLDRANEENKVLQKKNEEIIGEQKKTMNEELAKVATEQESIKNSILSILENNGGTAEDKSFSGILAGINSLIEDKSLKVDEMKYEIETARQELEDEKKANNENQTKARDLIERMSNTLLETHNKAMRELMDKIQGFKKAVTIMESLQNAFKDNQQKLKYEKEIAKAQHEGKYTELLNLKDAQHQEERESLTDQLKAKDKENEDNHNRIDALEKEKYELKTNCTKLEGIKTQVTQTAKKILSSDAETEEGDLNAILSSIEQLMDKQKEELKKLTIDINTLTGDKSKLEEDKANLNDENKSLKDKYQIDMGKLSSENENNEKEWASQKEKLQEHVKEITTIKENLENEQKNLISEKKKLEEDTIALNKRIEELNKTKEQLEASIHDLKMKNKAEMDKLEAENKNLNERIESLSTSTSNEKQEIDKLLSKNQELVESEGRYRREKVDLEEEKKKLEKDIEGKMAEITSLTQEKEKLNQTLQEEKDKLTIKSQELIDCEGRYKKEKADLEEEKKRLNQTLQDEKDKLAAKSQELIDIDERYKKEKADLEEEKEKLNQILQDEKDKLTAKSQELIDSEEKYKKEKVDLEDEKKKLNQMLQDEKDKLTAKNQELIEIEERYKKEKADLEEEKKKLNQILQDEKEKLAAKSQELIDIEERYKKEKADLEEEKKKLEKDIESKTAEIKEVKLEKENLDQMLQDEKEKFIAKSHELIDNEERYKNEKDELEEKKKTLEKDIESKTAEITGLVQEKEKLNQTLQDEKQEKDKLIAKNQELIESEGKHKKEKTDLEEEKKKLEKEIENKIAEIASLMQEKDKLNQMLQDEKAKLEQEIDEHKKAVIQLEEAKVKVETELKASLEKNEKENIEHKAENEKLTADYEAKLLNEKTEREKIEEQKKKLEDYMDKMNEDKKEIFTEEGVPVEEDVIEGLKRIIRSLKDQYAEFDAKVNNTILALKNAVQGEEEDEMGDIELEDIVEIVIQKLNGLKTLGSKSDEALQEICKNLQSENETLKKEKEFVEQLSQERNAQLEEMQEEGNKKELELVEVKAESSKIKEVLREACKMYDVEFNESDTSEASLTKLVGCYKQKLENKLREMYQEHQQEQSKKDQEVEKVKESLDKCLKEIEKLSKEKADVQKTHQLDIETMGAKMQKNNVTIQTLNNSLDDVRDLLEDLAGMIPVTPHDDILYNLLRAAKADESTIDSLKAKRGGIPGRKTVGGKK